MSPRGIDLLYDSENARSGSQSTIIEWLVIHLKLEVMFMDVMKLVFQYIARGLA